MVITVFSTLQIQILGFISKKTITNEDDFFQNTTLTGAYERESLNNEVKRFINEDGYYTEASCPFTIKPSFSTSVSNVELSPQGPIIGFVFDDSTRNLLGFHETILYKEYNLSPNPVDILSFDNMFLECDSAQGIIF